MKKLVKKVVMFLIKTFLLEKRWRVIKGEANKGKLSFLSKPDLVYVVDLGVILGFIRGQEVCFEPYEPCHLDDSCFVFSEETYLFDNKIDALDFYTAALKRYKPKKPKVIAKGPGYEKKTKRTDGPINIKMIGPNGKNKLKGNKGKRK